jgi:hypothetical protein
MCTQALPRALITGSKFSKERLCSAADPVIWVTRDAQTNWYITTASICRSFVHHLYLQVMHIVAVHTTLRVYLVLYSVLRFLGQLLVMVVGASTSLARVPAYQQRDDIKTVAVTIYNRNPDSKSNLTLTECNGRL